MGKWSVAEGTQSRTAPLANISETEVCLPAGKRLPLLCMGPDWLTARCDGAVILAQANGGMLQWSDGEVWHRKLTPESVAGRWLSASGESAFVHDRVLVEASGTHVSLSIKGSSVVRQDGLGWCALADGALRWSDGQTWTRDAAQRALEGRWFDGENAVQVSGNRVVQMEGLQEGSVVCILPHVDNKAVDPLPSALPQPPMLLSWASRASGKI